MYDDCDGDGKRDVICSENGKRGIILSSQLCRSDDPSTGWPNNQNYASCGSILHGGGGIVCDHPLDKVRVRGARTRPGEAPSALD